MRLINLNKLHTKVLYNIKRPILTGYFPVRASVPVHTTLAIKYIFLAVLASEIKQKEVLTLCCTFCVFSSRRFIIRTCATVRWASLHSSSSLFFLFLLLILQTQHFFKGRAICVFFRTLEYQIFSLAVIIYTFRKQRAKDWKEWGERSRWLSPNMYGGLIAPNLWRPRKKIPVLKNTQRKCPQRSVVPLLLE